ncbi:cryptochrome/photolyase family protein [Stratiformator vulcanicus]|uniref:Deoxyribodipyrimidine photo-lyase-related protein n=1 Tax=Stratiformator vulcanicus TaxID=2527980 RepID=A0A517R155_9PLAN|nr:cryptochrome/photolyase family protein [Stratiformator vulcanicus]QDT37564.1 Deoxyribodipyrimidine photo-lyase-related protein [Stratiformator vulcanicus]
MRNLILILGDQLDADSSAFDDFDSEQDAVWMAEVEEETSYVWSHKLRIAFFFSCMRHFRDYLRERDIEVHYQELTHRRSDDRGKDFQTVLRKDIYNLRPQKLIVTRPGHYRVLQNLEDQAEESGLEIEIRPDRHFYCDVDEFTEYADGRKSLLLETFYRQMRKKHDVLMTSSGDPEGDNWNFDEDNREVFGKQGPDNPTPPHRFRPDDLTQEVLELVEKRWSDHPGSLNNFTLPVTRPQALQMLRDFIDHSLPKFGTFEDAMWTDEAFLYHSRLSAILNVKLLNPRECVEKAVEAYHSGHAELNNVEGFVRQLIGWREFVRGIYWLKMPDYAEKNALSATRDLPKFFWDGQTDMNCVRHAMQHVLDHGYTHHIERLMVLGNLSLMYGADPYKFHEWHMAMYLDSVDWASLPNTLGMSQYGDGGIVGTKPYCSTGKYIKRMSNYCEGCRYRPEVAHGDEACPFTTFYWDFLTRSEKKLANNNRMALQLKNIDRKRDKGELGPIREHAKHLRESWAKQ